MIPERFAKIDRRALKQAARENMRASRPSAMRVTLLFLMLTSLVSLAVSFVVSDPAGSIIRIVEVIRKAGQGMPLVDFYAELYAAWLGSGGATGAVVIFLNILLSLYTMVLNFGYHAYTLRRVKGEETGYGDLLCGFTQVGRVLVMQMAITLYTLGWGIMIMVPVVMATIFGTMILLSISESLVVVAVIFVYVVMFAAMFLVEFLIMRYVLAPFALAEDPDMGAMAAIRKSRDLLRGRLGEAFTLSLSFLGWALISVLIVLVTGGVLGGILGVSYFAGGSGLGLVIGAYLMVILMTVVVFPFQMWYTPYYYGTFALYYTELAPKPAEPLSWQDAERPEPF